MADSATPSAADPQAGSGAAPQAGTPKSTTTFQADSQSTAAAVSAEPQAGAEDRNAEPMSVDEARKLRQEAHSLRQRLAQAEKRVKEHDDAQLSESERLANRVKELETALATAQAAARDKALRLTVEREARALRLVDEDAAYRLLDHDALELDPDSGEPKNVKALLKKLAAEKPYLVAPDPTGAATATTANGVATAQPQTAVPLAGAALVATPRPDSARPLAEAELARLRAATDHRARSYL